MNDINLLSPYAIVGLDFALEILKSEKRVRERYYWRQEDGSIIEVRKMSDSQIDRAISMLERIIKENKSRRMSLSSSRRGSEME